MIKRLAIALALVGWFVTVRWILFHKAMPDLNAGIWSFGFWWSSVLALLLTPIPVMVVQAIRMAINWIITGQVNAPLSSDSSPSPAPDSGEAKK